MRLGSADFLRRYFTELDAQGISYVILHFDKDFPDRTASDVDFAVRTKDLPKLRNLAHALAERSGWRVAHVIVPHIYSLYTVVVDAQDPEVFLQLDACGHYVESGSFFFSDAQLLAARVQFKGFSAPAPAVEFGYLLAKALAKGKAIGLVLPRLLQLEQQDPAGCGVNLEKLLGTKVGNLEDWGKIAPVELARLRQNTLLRHRFGLGDKLREWIRAARRVARPKGLHLAILGPEGPVASAVLERVGPILQKALFRSLRVYRFGPRLSQMDPLVCHSEIVRERPSQSRFRAIAMALRWAGAYLRLYFSEVIRARVRNSLVIFSPSPDDLIIHPERYGLAPEGWGASLLSRVLPRADLTVILAPPPEETPLPEEKQQIEKLGSQRSEAWKLAQRNHRYLLVSSQLPLDETIRAVSCKVLEFLAAREKPESH